MIYMKWKVNGSQTGFHSFVLLKFVVAGLNVLDPIWDASDLVAWQLRKVIEGPWTSSCFISKSNGSAQKVAKSC